MFSQNIIVELQLFSELEEHLAEFEVSDEKLTRELEDCQEQQKDLEAQVADFSKQVDLICTKQSAMQAKREEITKKVCLLIWFNLIPH